ncbi:hypothetical protein OG206_22245 [Streptomyces sp. NBC_01341]|nr:hypothetical protein OG206_22245 [Streptomyces sp. NBC_01341]
MSEYEQGQERALERSLSWAAWRKVALRLGLRLVLELVFWHLRNM